MINDHWVFSRHNLATYNLNCMIPVKEAIALLKTKFGHAKNSVLGVTVLVLQFLGLRCVGVTVCWGFTVWE